METSSKFEGKTMLVCDATLYADGWELWCDRGDMNSRLYGSYGERVKRPAPKALDADGVPIKVGDTVTKWTIRAPQLEMKRNEGDDQPADGWQDRR